MRFFPVRVRLTWAELLLAANVGVMRNIQCLKEGWKPGANAGLDNLWTYNIEGAAGEAAVAKALGMFWSGNIGDLKADDVGRFQVRTNASRKLDDMVLRPKDRLDRVYISVLSFAPEFVICGWITGSEGKQPQWLREGTVDRPPGYFVPRAKLHLERLVDAVGENVA